MLVGPEDYQDVYDVLKSDVHTSEDKSVLIFVATDSCDSVCAVKVLQTILHRHSVHFAVYPVKHYTEVQELYSSVVSDRQDLSTLILINCGATEDIAKLIDPDEVVRVIVIDCHRPFHHNLKSGNKNIVAFCNPEDGTCKDVPEPDGFSGSEDEEGDGEGSDQEFDDNAENDSSRPNRRQRVSPDNQHRGVGRYTHKQEAKRDRRRKKKEYYQKGTSSGEPASCMLYKLAVMLHLEDNHLLWLSILGLTDHLVHQRISAQMYETFFLQHKAWVSNTNRYDNQAVIEVERRDDDIPGTTTVTKPVFGQISQIEDYCFPLMRHWTLYEAILHASYVAVRLQTWHDKGRRLTQEMLVKMGFPAPQFKQKFSSMDPRYRKLLHDKLAEFAPKYHLLSISFKSFELAWAWRRQTAGDTVYAVTALLEISSSKQSDTRDDNKDRFWRAWDALSVEQAGRTLKHGIELSKRVQQGVLNTGGLILARALGHTQMRKYHMYNLSNQDISNKEMMTRPTMLAQLGSLLMNARGWQNNRCKDVVMISPPNAEKMCLVLAVMAQTSQSERVGNPFGASFRAAAEDIEAQVHVDGFDQSAMLINADDVQRFVMTLNAKLCGK